MPSLLEQATNIAAKVTPFAAERSASASYEGIRRGGRTFDRRNARNANRTPAAPRTPPAITMPPPRRMNGPIRPPSGPTPGIGGAMSAANFMSGALTGGATGAGYGAMYSGEDRSMRGRMHSAFRGAMGGAVVGSMAGTALPAAARYGTTHNKFMSVAGSNASNLTQISKGLNTAEGRNAMFMAGGLLGGAAFGGNDSKRRGFNQNRGNRINSSGY